MSGSAYWPGSTRVVAHGDLLQRPGFRITVTQIDNQSTVLSQVGRTTIGERLTIKGELDGVVATVDGHLDGTLAASPRRLSTVVTVFADQSRVERT